MTFDLGQVKDVMFCCSQLIKQKTATKRKIEMAKAPLLLRTIIMPQEQSVLEGEKLKIQTQLSFRTTKETTIR